MDTWAYGLPALEAGRWWTPLTGTFFVAEPWLFVPTLIGFVGMGLLEYARGTRVALAYFWIGQVVAVLATSLLLAVLSVFSGWDGCRTPRPPSTWAPAAVPSRASPP